MTELLLIVFFGGLLVYVIYRFTSNKGTSRHGIEVVTQGAEGQEEKDLLMNESLIEDNNKEMKQGEGEKKIKKMEVDVEQECIEAIVKNPKDLNAYLKLSVFYMQRKKWKDAKEVLLEAAKIDDKHDKVNNNLGVVWYKLKRYNNAVNAFEKSLKTNDKVPHRYMNIGLCWTALGENEKASEYFSKAVALDPEQKDYQELLTEVKSMLV